MLRFATMLCATFAFCLHSFAPLMGQKPSPSTSIAAFTTPTSTNAPSVVVIPTGFEASEGFALGYCEQNGWTAFAASVTQGTIDNTNPVIGAQHMRIGFDPSVSTGTNTGCFSPNQGPLPSGTYVVEVLTNISLPGGADYDIAPQSPSQGFITTRTKFSFLGDILVLDETGGSVQFVDTGADWIPGAWVPLVVVMDAQNDMVEYYYNNALIYTGVAGIFAGTSVEQVVFLSDNFHIDDVGDFDEFGQLQFLPVELLSFEASTLDAESTVELRWKTASETNNAGFAIEQNVGTATWREVGWVDGAGTKDSPQAYSYRVEDLQPGTYRFRLRQVDLDGSLEYSASVEATLSVPGDYVLSDAYPNPFNPTARFSVAVGKGQHVTVTLHDVLGRTIRTLFDGTLESNDRADITLRADGLESGLYMYRATGNNFTASKTVTIVK